MRCRRPSCCRRRRRARNDRVPHHHRAHPAQRHLRRRRVRDRRCAAGVNRRRRGARQPSGQGRTDGPARSDAAGSLHRDGAARNHGGEPRPRHVWRARARRRDLCQDRRRRRTGVARVARTRERDRDRHPHLLPHRHRRDDPEVTGAPAGRDHGALDHATDAVDQDPRFSAGRRPQRHRQRGAAAARRQPPGAERRAVLHARGTAARRPGERRTGRHSRRVRTDAAGAVRVRQPDGGRSHGATGADYGPAAREHARSHPRTAGTHAAYALPGDRARPRSHRRDDPHQGSAPVAAAQRADRPAARAAAAARARKPRRSTRCWRR